MTYDVSVKDLDSLIRFREHLVHFNTTLRDEFNSMRAHWNETRQIWHDEKAHDFERELDELWPGIRRYLEATGDHEVYLRRLIELLEDVRRTHL
jgi:hypothetical protein